jgi:hypothetical protein
MVVLALLVQSMAQLQLTLAVEVLQAKWLLVSVELEAVEMLALAQGLTALPIQVEVAVVVGQALAAQEALALSSFATQAHLLMRQA